MGDEALAGPLARSSGPISRPAMPIPSTEQDIGERHRLLAELGAALHSLDVTGAAAQGQGGPLGDALIWLGVLQDRRC
eukprot:8254662-Lingulodinium_polyedra.AAC.1